MDTVYLLIILAAATPFVYWIYVAHIKGAPFLPTPKLAVNKMLAIAKIKPGEKVYDIGCGDGRLVIQADKQYQAEAIGFEVSPPIFLYTKLLHKIKDTKTNARILFKDSRNVDFSDADVIIIFLLPDPLKNFWREKLKHELKPSARVVSYAFPINGWMPTKKIDRNREKGTGPIYFYKMDLV